MRVSERERKRGKQYSGVLDLCVQSVSSSIYTGFSSIVLSTIERRYQFTSTAAGLVSSTYDLAVLVSVVFISYFGGKGHKPRWLGVSLIIQGVGTIKLLICIIATACSPTIPFVCKFHGCINRIHATLELPKLCIESIIILPQTHALVCPTSMK